MTGPGAQWGLLLGDVTGDGAVNSTGVREAKRERNARTDGNKLRADINTNGRIDNGDFTIVKTQLGTMLPP